jgi:hypothetical protein
VDAETPLDGFPLDIRQNLTKDRNCGI